MMKRALLAVAGLVALAASLPAQPTEQLSLDGATLDQATIQSPSLSLEDSDRFFFSSAFGSMGRTHEFLPSFDPSEPLNMAYLPSSDRNDSLDRIIDWDARNRIRFGGEAGVFYGKSTGKYGREDFIRYISGTIGNEMFSISVGYLRQETTFDAPRRRR
jgi:hypothetical protein